MIEDLAIEPAGSVHSELLAALVAQCLDPGWSAASISSFLAVPGSYALLAVSERGKIACGFILCRAAGGSADVAAMGVVPEMRRRGIGGALLSAARDEARKRGATEMFLEVAETNAAARALYGAAGFEEIGRRSRYYQDGKSATDALVLRRAL